MKGAIYVSILCSIFLASCKADVQNTANSFNSAVNTVTDTAGKIVDTTKDTIELGKQGVGKATETVHGIIEKADQVGQGISDIKNGVKTLQKELTGAENSSN